MADREAAHEDETQDMELSQQEAQVDELSEQQRAQDSTPNEQKTSYSRIKSLQGLLKALLRSPSIPRDRDVEEAQITEFTRMKSLAAWEVAAVQKIANALLPFTPDDETRCFMTELPFVVLSSTILSAIGYKDHIVAIHPDVAPHKIHVQALTPAIMYEILTPHNCGRAQGQYQVLDDQNNPITSRERARDNPDAMLWSFFDQSRVESLADRHRMEFCSRIIVRPDKTVSIVGIMKEGCEPLVSAYEERQRKRRKNGGRSGASATIGTTDKTLEQLQADEERATSSIKELQRRHGVLKKKYQQTAKERKIAKKRFQFATKHERIEASAALSIRVRENRQARLAMLLNHRDLKNEKSRRYKTQKVILSSMDFFNTCTGC
ncbi:hypothetical protein BDB00DRAFT_165986 [Zychaea mexicana]|uniref:uncharacterized protein n=1 Tax=Zychaea mexicana TaxID=64656 RepID=UPI0022FEE964|nr:uncharacterized protein BDB00DRAFT_165986 [Zychaea mexicana]KAI9496162.1 hypothetical protein BDB00DRAFT_165986 [Zychaea mexicana]